MGVVPEFLGKEPIQPVIRIGQGRRHGKAGAAKAMGADGDQKRFGGNLSARKVHETLADQVLARQRRFHTRILYDDGGNNQTHLSDPTLTCQYTVPGSACHEYTLNRGCPKDDARGGFLKAGAPLRYFS